MYLPFKVQLSFQAVLLIQSRINAVSLGLLVAGGPITDSHVHQSTDNFIAKCET